MTSINNSYFVSTRCLEKKGYRKSLEILDDHGIDRVELGYCPTKNININNIINTHNFDLIAHNYFHPIDDEFILNLASLDAKIRKKSIQYVKKGICICHIHGIPQYTIHSGFRVDPGLSYDFTIEILPPKSECLQKLIESLESILSFAEKLGVKIAIENNAIAPPHIVNGEPVVLLATPEEWDRLLRKIDVDILLDLGHLKTAANSIDFDISEFIKTVRSNVGAIHLHTNEGKTDQHLPAMPGTEIFDICQYFPSATVTVEAKFKNINKLLSYLNHINST
jgi:sugar phosphate isomerase/epimerase